MNLKNIFSQKQQIKLEIVAYNFEQKGRPFILKIRCPRNCGKSYTNIKLLQITKICH
jgi:pantothenate kinase-related protein Tda10